MGRLAYLRDVVTLHYDPEHCVGCGTCVTVCPQGVFGLDNGRARIVDRDACMECGACARNCPAGTVRVQTGVGCAAAIINAALGRKGNGCRCVLEDGGPRDSVCCDAGKSSCC
jgi:ferredoxin